MAKHELIDVHHSSLYLHQLCLSWDHHDVVIMSSDGAKVPAHKLILLSRSEYFKKMFANSAYSDENRVVLPYSSECIKQILRFLYSGKLNLKDSDFRVLLELMDASRMMLMYSVSEDERGGIADYIEDYIIEQVFKIPEEDYYSDDEASSDEEGAETVEEIHDKEFLMKVVEILNYSIANRFPTLMNVSICFLKDIVFQFLESEAFSNLSFPALSELLRFDALADLAEVEIFSAVECWLNFSQDHMDQKVPILQLIRFDQMSVREIFDTVKPSGFLEDKELLGIVESIVCKDKLKEDNSRRIRLKWGCMENASRVPMWVREISVKRGPPMHWTAENFQTNFLNKEPLTELGFNVVFNKSDTESDDGNYSSEEDLADESIWNPVESDSSTDDDDIEDDWDYSNLTVEQNRRIHEYLPTCILDDGYFQTEDELNDYIKQRDLL